MSARHTRKEEIFTHEYLWRSSSALAEIVESTQATSHHFIIPALVMTLMAFEAFVNFCGFVLLPDIWKNEREEFRGKGIEGKLTAIAERLPNFEWRKGEDPYQSIKRLFTLRNLVAHGEVYANKYDVEHDEGGEDFRWNHPWDTYLTTESVAKAREDVRSFCQSIVEAMRDESDHPHIIHHDAFMGPLGSGFGQRAI